MCVCAYVCVSVYFLLLILLYTEQLLHRLSYGLFSCWAEEKKRHMVRLKLWMCLGFIFILFSPIFHYPVPHSLLSTFPDFSSSYLAHIVLPFIWGCLSYYYIQTIACRAINFPTKLFISFYRILFKNASICDIDFVVFSFSYTHIYTHTQVNVE